jgi:cytidylate kinase
MPVIIISSDSYQTGREISESAGKVLGYGYIGREILKETADRYKVPEAKLTKALNETPSFLGISSKLRDRYLAYIQEAALSELLRDNVVCQGLAAHLYVLGVPHVLRVRILSDVEKRAAQLVSQHSISHDKARKLLEREKQARRSWSKKAFRLDETDPSQYDLVIGLSQIDQEEAVKIIKETVGYARFRAMTYSIQCMEDLALASKVRAMLLERFPDARVHADRGTLVIETLALKREKEKKTKAIKEIAGKIHGVQYVEVHVINDFLRQAAESFR